MSKIEICFPLITGKIKNVNVKAKPKWIALAGKPLNIPRLNKEKEMHTTVEIMPRNSDPKNYF